MQQEQISSHFVELLAVMTKLRSPEGCPWDREQNHQSLIPCLVEECAELNEALLENDDAHLIEELGDVLLQVVFHAELAREEGRFGMGEVIAALNEKLISRHPHVFGEGERLGQANEVVELWEAIKKREKEKQNRLSLMDGVPLQLPALQYGAKIQSRAAKVGFDWPSLKGVFEKIDEEIAELKGAIAAEEKRAANSSANEKETLRLQTEEELGDLLFTLVNLARHLDLAPEQALQRANRKFSTRFRAVEQLEADLKNCTAEELELLWQKVKRNGAPPSAV